MRVSDFSLTRRSFIVASSMASLAFITGCSGDETSTDTDVPIGEAEGPEEVSEETKKASVGDAIEFDTEYGTIEITVEGMTCDKDMLDRFSGDISDGTTLVQLLLIVENKSFDRFGDNQVYLSDLMRVEDEDGISMTEFGLSWDYGGYDGTPGLYFGCQIGEKKRVAMFLSAPDGTKSATAVFGNTEVPVEIQFD